MLRIWKNLPDFNKTAILPSVVIKYLKIDRFWILTNFPLVAFLQQQFICRKVNPFLQNSVNKFYKFDNIMGTVDKKASNNAVQTWIVFIISINFKKVSSHHRKIWLGVGHIRWINIWRNKTKLKVLITANKAKSPKTNYRNKKFWALLQWCYFGFGYKRQSI